MNERVYERCDFHTHTRASDGSETPTELLRRAAANKVVCLAVTDHDTIDGVAEARDAGARAGVEVLAGIELSVNEADGVRTLHVLGLGLDDGHPALRARLAELRSSRESRAARIVGHLRAAGIALELAAVEAHARGGSVGRPHVARALVDAGAARDVEDAFARWLRRGRPGYEPNAALSAREAIALVHAAGGVAVLAHPPLSGGIDAPGGLDAFVERLVPLGLDGLEVWHPNHKPAQTRRLRRLAETHALLETGGSDFHGADRPEIDVGRGRAGKLCVGRDVRDALEARLAARRAQATAELTLAVSGSNLARPV
ncbi:MAG TPA: PHP domain-containing protein [Myxococcota bacterium]|nr:PHP domain-containing protein [Myxococcota bacterium]